MTSVMGDGWQFDVDEGPDWLFLRLRRTAPETICEPAVAACGWATAQERQKTRIIFELGDEVVLTSHLAGQLMLLHKRAQLAGGRFRICGFSAQAYTTLRMMHMADRFPNYATREDAVLGRLPPT